MLTLFLIDMLLSGSQETLQLKHHLVFTKLCWQNVRGLLSSRIHSKIISIMFTSITKRILLILHLALFDFYMLCFFHFNSIFITYFCSLCIVKLFHEIINCKYLQAYEASILLYDNSESHRNLGTWTTHFLS